MIDKYYKPAHPDVEITYTLYPTDGSEYRNKLDTVIATAPTGSEAPDVFALEAAFVKYYVNSDTTAPLSDLGFTAEDFANSIPAMVQIGTDSQEETDRYWNAIVGNGGAESACGWCKDKWGLNWQITPHVLTTAMAQGGDVAKRAFEAMMTMQKIDHAAIEAAVRGV